MPRLGMRAGKRLSKPAFQLIDDSLSYSLPNPKQDAHTQYPISLLFPIIIADLNRRPTFHLRKTMFQIKRQIIPVLRHAVDI